SAHCAFHFHLVGDDVVAVAPFDCPNSDNQRLERINPATANRLQGGDTLGSNNNRIDAVLWNCSMRLLSAYRNRELVRGSHRRAGLIANLPDFDTRSMKPKDCLRTRILESTFLNHQVCATLFTLRRALFSRLKNEFDRA